MRHLPAVSRRARLALALGGLVAFVLVSAGLARVLTAGGAERAAVTALVRDEARGDAQAAARHVAGCAARAGCAMRLSTTARGLRRAGAVQILAYTPAVGFSLGGDSGVARVAWTTRVALRPVVQCVGVRRTGNPVTGLGIELTAVTPPRRSDASCPASL